MRSTSSSRPAQLDSLLISTCQRLRSATRCRAGTGRRRTAPTRRRRYLRGSTKRGGAHIHRQVFRNQHQLQRFVKLRNVGFGGGDFFFGHGHRRSQSALASASMPSAPARSASRDVRRLYCAAITLLQRRACQRTAQFRSLTTSLANSRASTRNAERSSWRSGVAEKGFHQTKQRWEEPPAAGTPKGGTGRQA
jgi:hypothetical protein